MRVEGGVIKRCIVCVLGLSMWLWYVPAVRSDAGISYDFFVVDETLSAIRKDRENGSNLLPWADSHQTDAEGEQVLINVSNNCGFAEYQYKGLSLDVFLRSIRSEPSKLDHETVVAIGSIGEWCRLSSNLHERETLLTTRSWKGVNFIIDSVEIFTHYETGDTYLVQEYFIEEWNLGDLVKPIPDPGEQDSCWCAECMGPNQQKVFERENYERFGPYYCAVNGVYIQELPASLESRP